MRVVAPAKINLSLEILRRREDGFHELRTVMLPLALADEIEVEAAEGISCSCDDQTLPSGPENLAWRAADLFLKRAQGKLPGLSIHIAKKIPHGAGLGGGSSDAAAVLRAANELAGHPLTTGQLCGIAAEFGSDIPFFVESLPMTCEGRGEILSPLAFPDSLPVLLLKPPFPVPTPWAYKRWRDSVEVPGFVYAAQQSPWGELRNDLERPVFEKYLVLGEAKNWLLARGECSHALLSGSGSTVFAVLKSRDTAVDGLIADFRSQFGEDWWACATQTLPSNS